jgi:hypothetical protein
MLHQPVVRQQPDKSDLAAITVRRVVLSAEANFTPRKQGSKRRRCGTGLPGQRLRGESRRYPGKAHLAAIFQTEAVCVDHGCHAALPCASNAQGAADAAQSVTIRIALATSANVVSTAGLKSLHRKRRGRSGTSDR